LHNKIDVYGLIKICCIPYSDVMQVSFISTD